MDFRRSYPQISKPFGGRGRCLDRYNKYVVDCERIGCVCCRASCGEFASWKGNPFDRDDREYGQGGYFWNHYISNDEPWRFPKCEFVNHYLRSFRQLRAEKRASAGWKKEQHGNETVVNLILAESRIQRGLRASEI